MFNLVLFLVAILLTVLIFKWVKPSKKVYKGVIMFITLCCVAIAGVMAYSSYTETQAKEQYATKIKEYSKAMDQYSDSHRIQIKDIINDKTGKYSDDMKQYFRDNKMDAPKGIVLLTDLQTFADNYKSAHSIYSGNPADNVGKRESIVLNLEVPVGGVRDVVAVFNGYFINDDDVKTLLDNGVIKSWFFDLYNLDGTQIYHNEKGWVKPSVHDVSMFNQSMGKE